MTAIEARSGPRHFDPAGGKVPSFGTSTVPTLVLIYLLCVVLQVGVQAGPVYLTTLRVITLIMVVPLTINLFSGKYGSIIFTDILFFAHLAWIGLALAVNNPSQVVEQVGSVGVEFIGGYLIGRAFIRTAEDFIALCRLLLILILISTPFAIYETITSRPIIIEYLNRIPGITSVSIINTAGRMGFERVQSTFAHPIHFGLFCSVAFSLTYVALEGIISDIKRYIASGMILLTGLTALSSGALLAMLLQIFLIGWYTAFRNQTYRWWILFGLMALAYVAVDIASNRSPLRVFMSYGTFSAHNAYWRGIIFEWGLANVIGSVEKGISGNPLFGIGLGDWIRPSFMRSGSMDNFWLVVAVRYGLPGFLTLAIGYLLVIARVMRRDFSNSPRLTQLRRAWVFTFLGLTFTLCTVHVWTNIYSFVTFMFGAGIWLIKAEAQPELDERIEPALAGESPRSQRFTRFADNHDHMREVEEITYSR